MHQITQARIILLLLSLIPASLSILFLIQWSSLSNPSSDEPCPKNKTCTPYSEGSFIAGCSCGISAFLLLALATAPITPSGERRTAGEPRAAVPTAAQQSIELSLHPRARARDDEEEEEERNIGLSTPPPAYNPYPSSPFHPPSPAASSFFAAHESTPSSTSNLITPPHTYNGQPCIPGRNYRAPCPAWVPGRVTSDGEERVNDWRGKWNAKVLRMEGGTW